MSGKRLCSGSMAVALLIVSLSRCGGDDEGPEGGVDTLRISNGSGQPAGLLVDGQDAAGPVDDRTFVSSQSVLEVGELQPSAQSNEVFAFTTDRPPFHRSTNWTGGADTFDVAFSAPLRIPVTVWIVRGPFAQQSAHATQARTRTAAIWRDERMGVEFASFEIRDATGDPQAAQHFDFPDGDIGDVVWKPLRDDIGFVPGRVNVYWVSTVNGGSGTGWSNFGAQIAMGRNTGDELLSHELGHAFLLTHVNSDSLFNAENVMHSASNTRRYFTEGQLVRAHLDPRSVLNSVYNLRPGQLLRSCGYSQADAACPKISKRIWADGAFTPNGPPPSGAPPSAQAHCGAGEHPDLKQALATGGPDLDAALRAAYRPGLD